MPDIEKIKTGIFEMLQRCSWDDIDKERHRFQPVLNDALELLKEQHETIKSLEQEIRDKNVRLTERAEQVERLLKKSVPQSVVDQIRWERDTALSQLKEIGKGLGEKMDDAKLKKGHWEVRKRQRTYTGTPYIKYRCSVCGEWVDQYENSAFCPFCGADMRGEQE